MQNYNPTLLFILIIYSSLCFGQKQEQKLLKAFSGFNYKKTEKGIDQFLKTKEKGLEIELVSKIERELIGEYTEQFYSLKTTAKAAEDPNISIIKVYNISLLRKDQQLYRYKINKGEFSVGKGDVTHKLTAMIDSTYQQIPADLYSSFRSTYDVELDIKNTLDAELKFGQDCYLSPASKDISRDLFIYAANQRLDKFKEWLQSPTLELQLFGIQGIYLLEKEGIEIDEATISLIRIISKKKGQVRVCNGGNISTQTVEEVLESMK